LAASRLAVSVTIGTLGSVLEFAWQDNSEGRGQPLIAGMASHLSKYGFHLRHSLSNLCDSTFAIRGMADAKDTPVRPRIGLTIKTIKP
jgi:hypothetical protein